jgi:hypothetical protein
VDLRTHVAEALAAPVEEDEEIDRRWNERTNEGRRSGQTSTN